MKLTIKEIASVFYDDYISSHAEDPKEAYGTFTALFDLLNQMELETGFRRKLVSKISAHESEVERNAYLAGFIRSYEICQLMMNQKKHTE